MVYFIAEISSNHDSDIERCFRFIDKAAEIGCHSAKFQLFKIDQLFAPEILRHRPEVAARKAWELPVEFLPLLAQRCKEKEIDFSCSPFYLKAIEELEPYVAFYKIASYALLWDDLLIESARTGKPVILSTGMATLKEVEHAVDVLRKNGCKELTLLQCVSAYPAPFHDANLAAIDTLRKAFGCKVGWSDHTVEPGVLQRAIHHWGAEVIEFHFDLEGEGAEFKSGHCWLPATIKPVIDQLKVGIESDGNGIKAPVPAEIVERAWRTDPADGLRPLADTRKNYR
jgi:N-acetylneuraminate synthase